MTQEYLVNTYRRLPITFSSGLGNKLWGKAFICNSGSESNEAVDIAERVSRLVKSWIELKGV